MHHKSLLLERQESSLDAAHNLVVPRLVIRRYKDLSFNEFFVVSVPTLRTLEKLLDGHRRRLDRRAHTSPLSTTLAVLS
jgi:hypothetical protein